MDRKEAVRRYKETPRTAGVYRVLHSPSGMALIGASPDAPAMLRRIRFQLDMKSYPNKRLQHDWDTDGDESFVFDVVDVLPPPKVLEEDTSDDLQLLLGMWTEKLKLEPNSMY